jgi:hypothetical protein
LSSEPPEWVVPTYKLDFEKAKVKWTRRTTTAVELRTANCATPADDSDALTDYRHKSLINGETAQSVAVRNPELDRDAGHKAPSPAAVRGLSGSGGMKKYAAFFI